MYADVVVLTYQAPDVGSYTYEIPEDLAGEIKIGQLVEVPFGTRTPLGLVINIRLQRPSGVETRPIARPLQNFSIILPYQIELLKWMANYYHAPLVNCLEAILPEIPTKVERLTTNANLRVAQAAGVPSSPSTALGINSSGWQAGKGSRQRTVSGVRFDYESSESRRALAGGKRLTGPAGSQTIVLVPTINRIPETLARFPQAKNYILYHNQLKLSERFKAWLAALGGNVDFIFGSRSAIFVPCPRLSKIIIFDEHDGIFKDERSPYFDTLTIAEKLQQLTDTKLQIYDQSPKITTYFLHKDEIKTPRHKSRPLVKIVSMQNERKAGNKLPISDFLSTELVKTYKRGGTSLLFLNKKIESGQIFCKNCHHQIFAKTKPQVCPSCQSMDLFFYSLNIATLANLVRSIIPSVPIKLIAEGIEPARALSPIHIATASIFYAQSMTKYDLAAHVSVDNVLNTPDFTSAERTYEQINDLARLTRDRAVLILQTYHPQSDVIVTAASGNYLGFRTKHLVERKELLYPPYALLVKLTVRGKDSGKILKKAEELAGRLKEKAAEDIFVLGPYRPFFTGSVPRYNIILKKKLKSYSLKDREKALEEISDLLKIPGQDWQITVEPHTLN